nr:hypothetical protein [Rhizobium sp. ACO-34A]
MPELTCIILAKPKGSGKSSAFPQLKLDAIWINADDIEKSLAQDDRSKDLPALAP